MRRHVLFSLTLLLWPLANLTAQEQATPLEPGARVRVWHQCIVYVTPTRQNLGRDCRSDTGTLVSVSSESIILERDTLAEFRVPLDSVARAEMSRGRRSNIGKGAGYGALAGAVAGLITAGVACANIDCEEYTAVALAGGAGVFGAGGLLIGVGIGAAASGERWEEVPLERLRLQVAPQSKGGFGLGASIRF